MSDVVRCQIDSSFKHLIPIRYKYYILYSVYIEYYNKSLFIRLTFCKRVVYIYLVYILFAL